jgi:hypothetical protein
LAPQGVDGLRKLRTTVIRHFVATKKLSKEPGVELLLVQEYARKTKTLSRKGAKVAKKKEIKSRTGTPLHYFWYGSP